MCGTVQSAGFSLNLAGQAKACTLNAEGRKGKRRDLSNELNFSSNCPNDLIEAGDGGRDGEFAAGFCSDFDSVTFSRRYRFDLIPEAIVFAIFDAVLVDLYDVSPLEDPTGHGDEIYDQKGGGKDEIDKSLLKVKDHHRPQKEKERQYDDKNRALQVRGLDAVNIDDSA